MNTYAAAQFATATGTGPTSPPRFTSYGCGPLVILMAGIGSTRRTWQAHQVPALVQAGFRVVTVDPPDIMTGGVAFEDALVVDTAAQVAGLIESFDSGPVHLVGTSFGSLVTRETALSRPELCKSTVTMAAAGRSHPLRQMWQLARKELDDSGIRLPQRFETVLAALLNLSPATTAEPEQAQEWLDIFEFAASGSGTKSGMPNNHAYDRLKDYARISVPSLVIAFTDDRQAPPILCREVADVIPGARFVEISHCGHLGHLERPEVVNSAMVDFLLELTIQEQE